MDQLNLLMVLWAVFAIWLAALIFGIDAFFVIWLACTLVGLSAVFAICFLLDRGGK